MRVPLTAVLSMVLALGGCASFQLGDKSAEAALKRFEPVPDKTSLYVCREPAVLVASGVTTNVLVGGRDIGAVRPNTFVHTVVEPGRHAVTMKNDGLAGTSSPSIEVQANAGGLAFLWIGVTGRGFGTYTIDNFDSEKAAKDCVLGAAYAVKAP